MALSSSAFSSEPVQFSKNMAAALFIPTTLPSSIADNS
jgi:hypothetical protein